MVNKQQDPTDIWAWVTVDIDQYREKGGRWEVMVDNFGDFMQYLDEDTYLAEITMARALEEAKELGDVRWELLLRHWRLQFWLRQSQAKRALPEAIDLMTLATDPQVRDVPQRICAYHDVVECFLDVDAAGYHQEIAENSQEILSQLPQRHSCATCARSNWMISSAAAGNVEQAEKLMKQTQALFNEQKRPSSLRSFAETSILLGKLDQAEQFCKEACDLAREQKNTLQYLKSILQLAQVSLLKNDASRASRLIQQSRQISKNNGGPAEAVLLLELEGRLALTHGNVSAGTDYLVRAAQIYLDMGRYRDAAQSALEAAELLAKVAETTGDSDSTEVVDASSIERALTVAAKAVGQLPPASKDLYERLQTLGREPVAPVQLGLLQEAGSSEAQDTSELTMLQDLLQDHIANGHLSPVVITLYKIGRWHGVRKEYRAALDYIISSAALERLFKMDANEREDTLETLKGLKESLPAGTVDAALVSLTEAVPSWLAPLLQNFSTAQWSWAIRAIATELNGSPVVEPEPEEGDDAVSFNSWLNYAASLTALIVRFYQQLEETDLQSWWNSLHDNLQQIEQNVQQMKEVDAEVNAANIQQGLMIISFLQGLNALAHGAASESVVPQVLAPFNQIIEQICEIAKQAVWYHPGATPIDYLVEQAAQNAVEALRKHDDYRPGRLANLILRYKLMNIDIKPEAELVGIARFLDALQQLIRLDNAALPVLDPPLEAPFDAVLSAIHEAGKEAASESSDK